MTNPEQRKRGLYRSKKHIVSGVCAGIAEYFDFSIGWIRFGTIILIIISGFWPILGLYIALSLIMKPAPACPINSEEEREFYDSYANAPGGAAKRLKHRFEQLDKRIRRMEDTVTARAYEWEQRLHKNC
jgi:phage shock protein C